MIRTVKRMYGMARARAVNGTSTVRVMEMREIRSPNTDNISRILTRDSFPSVMFNFDCVFYSVNWPVLYCTVLYCTVQYCTVLYRTLLQCTIPYCTAVYCIFIVITIIISSSPPSSSPSPSPSLSSSPQHHYRKYYYETCSLFSHRHHLHLL